MAIMAVLFFEEFYYLEMLNGHRQMVDKHKVGWQPDTSAQAIWRHITNCFVPTLFMIYWKIETDSDYEIQHTW